MKLYLIKFSSLLLGIFFILFPQLVLAQGEPTTAKSTTYTPDELPFDPAAGSVTDATYNKGEELPLTSILKIDLGSSDPFTLTISIINILLSLLAATFLILLIYAGYLWTSARGNEEQVTKAKDFIKRAVIGLIIVFTSFGIASLIFTQIESRFNPQQTSATPSP